MFGLKRPTAPKLACYLSAHSFALVALDSHHCICLCEFERFDDASPDERIALAIKKIVERENLFGQSCRVILSSSRYQLLLMDALDVSQEEMSKAMRWQLKGMIDYPLNDIAVDTFFVPTQTSKRKSVFVAVTPQTALLNKIAMLEQCTLNVTSVSIAELALSELLQLNPNFTSAPCMVINASGSVCKIKIYFQNNLYLVRVLPLEKFLKHRDTEAYKDIVLEIQRSIDFGLMELKLSEPKNIVFTPGSQADGDLLSYLQSELRINVSLLDINAFFTSKRPINPSVISRAVYAIGGCLMTDGGKYDSVS